MEATEKQAAADSRYMRMAYIIAETSYAKRRRVGAVIVKGNRIVSDGYNGTPSGFPNICEGEDGRTLPYVLHAESNAILKAARYGGGVEGGTLYATTAPCIECAKLIIQAGISRVVYREEYRIMDGAALLKQAGIKTEQIFI